MPPPAPRDRFRRTRRLARVLAFLVLGLTAAAALAPRLLSGRRLARLVQSRLPPMCGHLELEAVSLGPGALFALLFERPFAVTVEHLRLADAEGETVLAAARVEGHLRVRRGPLQVSVEELLVENGQWAMKAKPGMSLTLLAAFRAPGHCRALAPARKGPHDQEKSHGHEKELTPAPPLAPSTPEKTFALREVHLQAMDVAFDFPDWALSLAQVDTHGELEVSWGHPGHERFSFDARDAETGAGKLRVGRDGVPWSARVPFDRVAIRRVAVAPSNPADLVLDVKEAHTGRAVLAGRAVFVDAFAHGRRAQPGLGLDATWTGFGDAARQLEASWRGLFLTAMGTEDVRLHATSSGAFRALAATVEASTDTLTMKVGLDPAQNLSARWTLHGFDTRTRLPAPLHPLLGGRADGHFQLEAKLAPHLVDMSGRLTDIALSLDRARPGPFPRTFSLALRPPEAPSVGPEDAARAERLDLALDGASLAQGTLVLERLRTSWRGASGTASATLTLPHRSAPIPHVDAHLRIEHLALARALPSATLTREMSGELGLDASLAGAADDLAMTFSFFGDRRLRVAGHTLTLPRRTKARIRHGDRLEVPGLTLVGDGGARLSLAGDAVTDGLVHARLLLAHLPVSWLGVAPAAAAGALGGELRLAGATRTPVWSGRLFGEDLRLGGAPFPAASISFTGEIARTRFEGRLDDTLSFTGDVRLGGPPAVTAQAILRRFSFAPWLGASPLGKTTLHASGELTLSAERAGVRWTATLPEVEAQLADVVLRSPTPWQARGSNGDVELVSASWEGGGAHLALAGRLVAGEIQAQATGHFAFAPWWNRLARSLPLRLHAGELALDAGAEGTLARPQLTARLSVVRPLAAEVPLAKKPAIAVEARGGALETSVSWTPRGPVLERLAAEQVVVGVPGGELSLTSALARRDDLRNETLPAARAGLRPLAGLVAMPPWLRELTGALALAGRVNVASWQPWLPPAVVPEVRGEVEAKLDLRFAGERSTLALTVGAPLLTLRTPLLDAPLSLHRFTLTTDGNTWSSGPFDLALGSGGTIALRLAGDTRLPSPALALVAHGREVHPPVALGRVSFVSSDFDLRLDGPLPNDARYRLSGDLLVRGTRITPNAPAPARKLLPGKGGSASWLQRLELDVHVRSPDITAVAPGPDLGLDADCHVVGPLLKPSLSGEVHGRSTYARAALTLYDWFRGSRLRHCTP